MTIKKSLWTKTTCAYCGVGCGIEAKVNRQGTLDIQGDKGHPANYGQLCSKGYALGETVGHQGRLLTPSIDGVDSDWASALEYVASQFSETIKKHGPDSVAFYVSGQLLTEDYYVANKLMKGFIGSANIDTNSRLCMSSAVAGHKRAFGSDTVPICYEDIEMADLVVITGSNLAWCHPVLFQRLKAAKKQRPELFIVVIDPRKTDTCSIADLHLAIQPDTDVALFNGLLRYLAKHKKIDTDYIEKYTEGFEEALTSAINDSTDQQQLLNTLMINDVDLNTFYQKFSNTDKTLSIYSQGVNQSTQGTDKVNSIINCHIATGRIGKPGMGPFSVTGQPNAMGGREVGGLANTLAAHMEFGDNQAQQLISDFWKTDTLASRPGLKAIDLFEAMGEGKIKAIWIMATNPVVSLPDSTSIIAALKKCPLVVVSDCIKDTATTQLANVLLPAQGWSEKSGTVTNSERRISRQRRILASPGEAKADWWIICEVAKRMGFTQAFNYFHEGEIFSEYAKMTTLGNQDGLTQLDAQGYSQLTPQQWPVTTLQTAIIQQRMFTDNRFFSANNKAQFIAVAVQKSVLAPCEEYPLQMNSGRIRDHWHTMTRTGLSSRLSAHISEPFVSINHDDAQHKNVQDGDLASVSSAQGAILVRVSISKKIPKGQVFIPIHWNQQTASNASVCTLITNSNVDPISGQPAFKSSAVNIKKWHYQSEAIFLSRQQLDISELGLSQFDYWVKQKVENGYLYRLADAMSPERLNERLKQLINRYSLVNQQAHKTLDYANQQKTLYRYARLHQEQILGAYIVATQLQNNAFDWIENLFAHPVDLSTERSLLSGCAQGQLVSGKIICACKQVGLNTLNNAINSAINNCIATPGKSSLEQLCQTTGAGTGCGSCLPEITELLNEQTV
ncbi:nitrate reductase [Psychromonas sp. Urea-02u-13]|uniref:nitrate reductase n=1 Tax=Psychromonas sp. Urea-02u-13 TaxID=2058326 RepID=UPI000C343C6E|nr:nitrate reductase [Psychromonas sp. Urea-02u-13]PKG40234.1 nitrate reductase [Psychromonas sp. Urea-02u-13]